LDDASLVGRIILIDLNLEKAKITVVVLAFFMDVNFFLNLQQSNFF